MNYTLSKSLHIIELYISITLLSFTGLFAKLIPWTPITIIFWRGLIAGAALFLVLKWNKRTLTINSRSHLIRIIGLGVLMVLHWVTFYWAIQLSTVAVGMISLYSYPVISAVLEPLFTKENYHYSNFLAAFAVFIGVIIMSPHLSLNDPLFLGSIVGIGSALLMSIRNILSRPLVKQYSGEIVMMYQMIGSLILLPFINTSYTWTTSTTINIVLLGTLGTAIAHTLWARSLAHFSATTTGVLSCLAPVIGAILSISLLGETVTSRLLIGGSIILSVTLLETKRHTR